MNGVGVIGEGLGELSLGDDLQSSRLAIGGDAANICVMAARAGAPARLLGRVGADGLGDRLRAYWADCGVDLSELTSDPVASTGLYLNETCRDGSHRFTYWRRGSAGSRLCEEDMRPSFFEGLGMLVVTGVTLAVSESSAATARGAVAEARRRGIMVACVINHRPALGADGRALAELIECSEIVIGSREDLAGVFGNADIALLRLTVEGLGGREIVITDGRRAATVTTAEGSWSQPAPARALKNSAGAGDALAGAYLAARIAGSSPAEALRPAVAAASISIERDGCAASYPSSAEVAEAVEELPGQARAIASGAEIGR